MRTYLAPLAALALVLRNVAARIAADARPVADYDGDDAPGNGLDVAPTAYAAIGPDGFRLLGNGRDGSFRDCACKGGECTCPVDPYTGAKGFGDDGEPAGTRIVGRHSTFDVEAELHAARLTLEEVAGLEEGDHLEGDSARGETGEERYENATALLAAIDGADGDHTNAYFSASEGLSDTNALAVPYWEAVALAHLEERRAEWATISAPVKAPTAKQAETASRIAANVAAAGERTARLERLRKRLQAGVSAYRKAHRSTVKGAGQAVLNDIGALVAMVEEDFRADQAQARRTGDYTGLVLTADQMEAFRLMVRRTKRQVEIIRAQGRPGVEPATPAQRAAMAKYERTLARR